MFAILRLGQNRRCRFRKRSECLWTNSTRICTGFRKASPSLRTALDQTRAPAPVWRKNFRNAATRLSGRFRVDSKHGRRRDCQLNRNDGRRRTIAYSRPSGNYQIFDPESLIAVQTSELQPAKNTSAIRVDWTREAKSEVASLGMLWVFQSRSLLPNLFCGDRNPLRLPIDIGDRHGPERNQVDSGHQFAKKRRQKLPIPPQELNHHGSSAEIHEVIGRASRPPHAYTKNSA